MYQYTPFDQSVIDHRVAQFRDQTERYLAGTLSDEQFLPLRLQNGLYIQRHAPMLRIAIPYGLINSNQIRALAEVSRRYDKGYLHVTTRQNVQLNWPKIQDIPDILEDLAKVQMHAIQTSGNCIRNTTTDALAGVAEDEFTDPRPWCELIRQWSTMHPEFAFLPRKFKIAVSASREDRAATKFHDIGLELSSDESGNEVFDIYVGGGLGRTPIVGQLIYSAVPSQALLQHLDAILRVYNLRGRRDNKYKARIKILVKALGVERFKALIDEALISSRQFIKPVLSEIIDPIKASFISPNYEKVDPLASSNILKDYMSDHDFAAWYRNNTHAHRVTGYRAVTISLKTKGVAPGDLSAEQLDLVADLAEAYSFSEARMTHEQNIVLSDVKVADLKALHASLNRSQLATANIGTLTDMICCPGGDFCALANAKSLPIAAAITEQFDDLEYLYDLGPINLNISGCMNACGHHHIGDIGILGVDKKGREFYQVSLGGGKTKAHSKVGKILGPSFSSEEIPAVINTIIDTFVANRSADESFSETYHRIGHQVFKESVYA